ncbi:hypothetical protein HCB17_06370 [Salinispora arenicola]|uniref:hypothetical protein n=1 Tax=Salinispora arenicola TaxID=168697 RepID=UPI00035EBF16|nr:hypothetical protein [Salinispora arenicola]NIL40835.1 hypothetical protein [Salinispora arenicola]
MSRLGRTVLAAGIAVVTATFAATVAPSGPAEATPPTAAVALGDSFISGEGAGAYSPVVNIDGEASTFPGWSAPNSNAYFCHRSANASLHRADLPGITARFNLACSGGQPYDIANASATRTSGRQVTAQLDQLRAVAQTHDIDLVLVGLGSNNSSFTFGSVAEKCANRFIADAWTGWWEFWAYLWGKVEQEPCSNNDLATAAELAAATAETTAAVRQILSTLAEVDADGQHRVVLQDYTNPLPEEYDPTYWTEDNRDDTRDKFRDLGAERYAAGCPAHRASLPAGHYLSQGLGTLVSDVHTAVADEFPGADVVLLNVQRAFDGARLCETADSPQNALATPVRLMDGPTGVFVTSLSGLDKLDIRRIANACVTNFQTCQESWHPNAAGHLTLGHCLTGAAATSARAVSCVRSASGAITVS